MLFINLFLHQTTTLRIDRRLFPVLFINLFLHQTTTDSLIINSRLSCLSIFSYIKPQLEIVGRFDQPVVYQSFPTSNHNSSTSTPIHGMLFINLFLHQTTTIERMIASDRTLFINLFLHQTTTLVSSKHLLTALFINLFLHQTTT